MTYFPTYFQAVKNSHTIIADYDFDEKNGRWCTVSFSFAVKSRSKFDVKSLIYREVDRFVVSRVPGIEKVIIREEQKNDTTVRVLQTQGINLEVGGFIS